MRKNYESYGFLRLTDDHNRYTNENGFPTGATKISDLLHTYS